MRNIRLLKTGGANIKPPRKYKNADIVKANIDCYKFPVEREIVI